MSVLKNVFSLRAERAEVEREAAAAQQLASAHTSMRKSMSRSLMACQTKLGS